MKMKRIRIYQILLIVGVSSDGVVKDIENLSISVNLAKSKKSDLTKS